MTITVVIILPPRLCGAFFHNPFKQKGSPHGHLNLSSFQTVQQNLQSVLVMEAVGVTQGKSHCGITQM